MTRRLARIITYGFMLSAVLLLAVAHARYIGQYVLWGSPRLGWTIAFGLLLTCAAYGAGFPEDTPTITWARLGSAVAVVLTAAVGISLVQLALGSALLPRFVLLWGSAFAVPWLALCAALTGDVQKSGFVADRVLAVVTGDEADLLRDELGRMPERRAKVVETWEPSLLPASRVPELAQAMREVGVDVVVLSRAAFADDVVVGAAAELHAEGLRVRSLSLFYEMWLGKLPVWELERTSLFFDIGELHRRVYARQKRIADLAASVVLLIVLLPLIPLVFVGNLIANRGPLIFRQQRVGRGAEEFTLYKFRSMKPGEDSSWTQPGDSRITGFGAFLRRSHLDELPQAWNMLMGDLSLIGPRPEQPGYVGQLSESIPFYNVRHLVRPGLTGWAQVKHAYGASVDDAMEKLQYDFFYLRRQSVQLDLRIIVRTIRQLVQFRGR